MVKPRLWHQPSFISSPRLGDSNYHCSYSSPGTKSSSSSSKAVASAATAASQSLRSAKKMFLSRCSTTTTTTTVWSLSPAPTDFVEGNSALLSPCRPNRPGLNRAVNFPHPGNSDERERNIRKEEMREKESPAGGAGRVSRQSQREREWLAMAHSLTRPPASVWPTWLPGAGASG